MFLYILSINETIKNSPFWVLQNFQVQKFQYCMKGLAIRIDLKLLKMQKVDN